MSRPHPQKPAAAGSRLRWLAVLPAACLWLAARADDSELFERRIRPLLAERCAECHGEKKHKGGLRLDRAGAWLAGGDSGPAIVPGDVERSRLIQAVRWDDSDLQMPPKNRLPPAEVALLEDWVRRGAPAPADGPAAASSRETRLSRTNHWAYLPLRRDPPPAVRDPDWSVGPVDRHILAALEASGMRPSPPADAATLGRRLHFALTGLPPAPEELDAFARDFGADPDGASGRLTDRLLASPRFGERWGRHWLDVVRFAESVTLRGLIFREAWRYRDYVITAFNEDRPFDEFVREQLAGDLMGGAGLDQRQRRMVAITFLALGNTNLEEQDKRQLDLDVVDEQLDVMGKAFLGQTLGCARCHDHKFDPIPTRDYYALAGILAGTRLLEHANVSAWTERPLPLADGESAKLAAHEAEVAALRARVDRLKTGLKDAAGGTKSAQVVGPADLPGIVVDDAEALAVGEWTPSTHERPFIGSGYRHDGASGKGAKTLTFQPSLPGAGIYEVRLAYTAGSNRSGAVPVTVASAEGERTVLVDERLSPPVEGRFVSLGRHRFEASGAAYVLVSNAGTTGHVVADAVQFLPEDNPGTVPAPSAGEEDRAADLERELRQAEADLKSRLETGPRRPMVMAPVESGATNLPVHRRGSVHNLGEVVPRGVLSVAFRLPAGPMPADQSGRRELADWIASDRNPLTARVFVNRVWHWLFGAGLVRSVDNFGITGDAPTHPALLDSLAAEFVDHGWSVKWLVRELVTSRTWRQAAGPAVAGDPENRLLGRFSPRRLDAESLRDTLLSVSGRLRLEPGRGPTFEPGRAADYGFTNAPPVRSVFLPVFRNALPELLTTFDFADPGMVTGARHISTVAPQALFLLNHPFVRDCARKAAERLLARELASDEARLRWCCLACLGRTPTESERTLVRRALAANPEAVAGWTEVFHALFASLDFLHLR